MHVFCIFQTNKHTFCLENIIMLLKATQHTIITMKGM